MEIDLLNNSSKNNPLMDTTLNLYKGLTPFGNPIIKIFFRFFKPIPYSIPIENHAPMLLYSHYNSIMPVSGLGDNYEITQTKLV